jgi:hypothetical protein
MERSYMKFKFIALGALLPAFCLSAFAQGTAFTYQGQLQNNGSPANGSYDLQFILYNANVGGSQAGPILTNAATAVSNGLFTVLLDFGAGIFTGANYWLDIAVRTNGGGAFMELTPRQPLTPTPYAIYAEGVTATGVSGTLTNGQLAHSAVTVDAGPGLSGGGKVALGNTITLTNTGVLSVTGNADITAATVGGAVTLGDTATSADTASTLVKRDGSGSFATASITLDGTLTLPTITPSTADIIYSGGALLLYNDNNWNFFSGQNAGNSGTSGTLNTANGVYALFQNTSGSDNTANGAYALYSNTNGGDNTAVGAGALSDNTGGSANTAVGSSALGGNTIGDDNTAVGFTALGYNTNGGDNTAIGAYALFFNMNGDYNTANGVAALYSNRSGSGNTANGYEALFSNTSGSYNAANGYDALYSNTSGQFNTADGYSALYSNTNGGDNTAIGTSALYYNTSGSFNTAIGEDALESATGSNNIALGYEAGSGINTGSGNIDIGNTGLSTDTNIIRIGYAQTQTYIAGVLLPPSPVLIQTNFIDGHRYTNNYGWPLMINAIVVLNTAGVVGSANESLCIEASPAVGGITNPCAISTLSTSAALHYTNYLGGFVPTNAIYWFTNLSTGSGNSASVNGGQIKYP